MKSVEKYIKAVKIFVCSAAVVCFVVVENSSSFDLDSPALEVTRGSEVVHHAVAAPLLLAKLEAPHGVKLGLGNLNWFS